MEGYNIIKTIGAGAMGQVYLAKNNHGIYYAIKESADFSSGEDKESQLSLKSLQKEANLLSCIKHPGLPRYYKSFNNKSRMYVVMEYIEGDTLEKKLEESVKPFSEKRGLSYGIQLCEILFYLHTLSPEPVIYRDLKPANIIITEKNTVRLIDFGVARRYDPKKICDTIRLGTPGYAAPEQYRTKGQSTPRSDIYSLGIVLHEIFTLHDPSVTPFKLPSIRHLNPNISEELEYMIKKAVSLDQRDRYVDMGLFREELLTYYDETFGYYVSPYSKSSPYMEIGHSPSIREISDPFTGKGSFRPELISDGVNLNISPGKSEFIPVFHSVPLPEKHDVSSLNENLNLPEKIIFNTYAFIKGFLGFLFTNPDSLGTMSVVIAICICIVFFQPATALIVFLIGLFITFIRYLAGL